MSSSVLGRLSVAAALLICLPALADDGKIQAELLQSMAQESSRVATRTHRVIISLDPGDHVEPWRHFGREGGPPEAVRTHIRQVQDRALSRMPPRAREQVSYRFQTQHALSAELTVEEIRELARLRDVVLIEEQPVHYRMHPESHPLTGTNDAHALGHTGAGTVIAVIDDGIMSSHAAFGGHSGFPTPKIIGGRDFADNDNDPRNDCQAQSHGTAVAGVAAGNGGGIVGTAPDANIVFLKIQSSGICGSPSLDGDVIGAIDWITANKATYGIDIINMSLGGGSFSGVCDSSHTAYRNAINAAHSAGITIFAASGNEATKSALARPACFSNVISVGAVYDANIGSANFGNCSDPSTAPDMVNCYSNSASFLDILAPSFCARTANTNGGTNTCFGGTSSASPFAAGVGALVLGAAGGSGSLTPNELRDSLVTHGVPVTDPANNITKPRVDTLASVAAVDGGGSGPGAGELSNGVPVTGLSGGQGSETYFTIEVPAGASNLVISISGGSGDADLYVRHGSEPTTGSWDCRPYLNGNNETCTFASPAAGTWYVMIRGFTSYSGVSLVASFDEPAGAPDCDWSGSVSNISGAQGSERRYSFDVPACASSVEVAISGGSGDADLYVRHGTQPTVSVWDCRPYLAGNNETCTFSNPAAGTWHIMIRGYSAYSGVNLNASYE